MMQRFDIPGRLPGLNEYVNACRGHWSRGNAMKREQTELVGLEVMRCRVKPMDGPIEVGVSWIEGKSRSGKCRDVDNIAFGAKFILDALVEVGIVPDDGPEYVRNVYHHFTFNADEPRVEVVLMPYDPEGRTVRFAPVAGMAGPGKERLGEVRRGSARERFLEQCDLMGIDEDG